MEKSRYVRVIERKEARGDNPIIYFLTTEIGSNFRVPEGVMAVEVPQNKEIFGGEKKSVLHSVREERIGGAKTLRNESKEKLFS